MWRPEGWNPLPCIANVRKRQSQTKEKRSLALVESGADAMLEKLREQGKDGEYWRLLDIGGRTLNAPFGGRWVFIPDEKEKRDGI